VVATDGREIADATSVHVAFDVEAGHSIQVPDRWRRRIAEYQADDPPA